jgi:hypothetical protein
MVMSEGAFLLIAIVLLKGVGRECVCVCGGGVNGWGWNGGLCEGFKNVVSKHRFKCDY